MLTGSNATYKLPIPSTILLVVATADGTSTSSGRMVGIALDIYGYSVQADTQILARAFNRDKDHGLLNALAKMKALGHLSVTGTIGYDIGYIHESATLTGRKLTFAINYPIRFGESRLDPCSQPYNSTIGELDLNEINKNQSTGFLYPESKLVLSKQGRLEYESTGRPMRLMDILAWQGTPGMN